MRTLNQLMTYQPVAFFGTCTVFIVIVGILIINAVMPCAGPSLC